MTSNAVPKKKPDATWSLSALNGRYEKLTQESDAKERLKREQKKLSVLIALETKLKKELAHQAVIKEAQEKKKDSWFKRILRQSFYYFLLSFGLFEDAAGSYLFGATLFALIPGIPNPMLIIASVLFTLLECLLFYAFEVTFLKDALGIPYNNGGLHQLIDTYSKQLKIVTELNQTMSTIAVLSMDDKTYEEYRRFVVLLNEDMRKKEEAIGSYKESLPKKILKIGVLVFGALSSIAGSYFMATSFMALGAASLLGTPLGWVIILLTITAGLGFYYAMGARSMTRLVNPDYENYQELKKQLKEFKENNNENVSNVTALRQRLNKKPSKDSATQTDDVAVPYHQPGLAFFDSVGGMLPAFESKSKPSMEAPCPS